MHVALLLNNFNGGGAERAHIMLANGLAEAGHRVTMVVVNRHGSLEPLLDPKVVLVDLRCPRAALALPKVVATLRDLHPDIVVSAMVIANVLAALASLLLPNLPVIAIEHGDMGETYIGDRARFAARIGYRIAPYVYGRFARIYCVDRSSASSVTSFTRRGGLPIRIMPNAVLGPDAESRLRAPCSHPYFDSPDPVFVNVGRLTEQKDHELLLRAFYKLNQQVPARLIVLGDGPMRPHLESLRDELGLRNLVDFPGFVDPFPVLSRASAFVLTSRWEALPTVIIEALYCGCPVVSTPASLGTLDLLGYGAYGRIAKDRRPQTLCDEMLAILEHQADAEALKAIAMRYDSRTVADMYAADLRSILNGLHGVTGC